MKSCEHSINLIFDFEGVDSISSKGFNLGCNIVLNISSFSSSKNIFLSTSIQSSPSNSISFFSSISKHTKILILYISNLIMKKYY